jgi:hypothetical protein
MPDKDARQELLDLLDKKAFDPVLNASPDDYTKDKRNALKDVQGTTRSTQKRYHDHYKTAQDVYANYKDDLSSDAAQDVDRELRDLGLPTLKEIQWEVEKKAQELGIS